MESSNFATLSVFGLFWRSLGIYFHGLTRFLSYGFAIFVVIAVSELSGRGSSGFVLTMVASFLFNRQLAEAWMVDYAASLFLGMKDQPRPEKSITMETSKGQSVAMVTGCITLALLSPSAVLSSAAGILNVLTMFFLNEAIVMEGASGIQAIQRSAYITMQVFLKLVLNSLLTVTLCGIVLVVGGGFLGLLAIDLNVEVDELKEWLSGFESLWTNSFVSFFFVPFLHVAMTGVYLQYRCQKEGMTQEGLVQEKIRGKKEDVLDGHKETQNLRQVVNAQTEVDKVLWPPKLHTE